MNVSHVKTEMKLVDDFSPIEKFFSFTKNSRGIYQHCTPRLCLSVLQNIQHVKKSKFVEREDLPSDGPIHLP